MTSLKLLCKTLLASTVLFALHTYAEQPKVDELLMDFDRVATATYRELAQNPTIFKRSYADLQGLLQAVDGADRNHQPEQAIGLVAANMNLIKRNLASEDLQRLARILLKHQALGLAQDILELVEIEGNDYQLGQLQFEFARHHAERGDWKTATANLRNIDIPNTLRKEDGDEAFILLGAALQQQKKHRQAIEYYARVKSDSTHYRVAQLNTAVAYIRQDWWTDAQLAIKNALKAGPSTRDELANRLYTVLGFSQLQHGFYRDARESFRDVHVKSRHTNRALLGIGMAALHQEDYVGALNAFNHLKKKDDADISVVESYLLGAFALEKLGQKKSASASYTEAITFYEQQIAFHNKLVSRLNSAKTTSENLEPTLANQINTLDAGRTPELGIISRKINSLAALLVYQPSPANQQALKTLNARLQQAYIRLATQALTQNQTVVNSYLSQARFGLAKLYDAE